MTPFHHYEMRGSAVRALPALVGIALSLSMACGSSQSDQLSAGGGAAGMGATGAAAAAGQAGSNAAGDHSGGAAGASGAMSGAAGVSAGNGGSSGATSGAAGALSGGGNTDLGAAGASDGGSTQVLACPAKPPSFSDSCNAEGRVCSYEDCAGLGRTVAKCERLGSARLTWGVQTVACGAVHCLGLPGQMSCAAGQICTVSEGGTISGTCTTSTCGSGPVTCACAHAACTDCAIAGSTEQGFTVTCNTCPQGGCP